MREMRDWERRLCEAGHRPLRLFGVDGDDPKAVGIGPDRTINDIAWGITDGPKCLACERHWRFIDGVPHGPIEPCPGYPPD
jgi:hypothetical protein